MDWNKILSGEGAEADSKIILATIKNKFDEITRKLKPKKQKKTEEHYR